MHRRSRSRHPNQADHRLRTCRQWPCCRPCQADRRLRVRRRLPTYRPYQSARRSTCRWWPSCRLWKELPPFHRPTRRCSWQGRCFPRKTGEVQRDKTPSFQAESSSFVSLLAAAVGTICARRQLNRFDPTVPTGGYFGSPKPAITGQAASRCQCNHRTVLKIHTGAFQQGPMVEGAVLLVCRAARAQDCPAPLGEDPCPERTGSRLVGDFLHKCRSHHGMPDMGFRPTRETCPSPLRDGNWAGG